MDYEDEQVKLIGGHLDGLFGKNVSLADSFFLPVLNSIKKLHPQISWLKIKGMETKIIFYIHSI